MEHGEQLQMFKRYNKEGGYSNVQYWIDENGQDWYDYADNATLDNMKILVNEKGVVIQFNQDATTLSPNDAILYEVPFDEVPEDLDIVKYSYDGEKFYKTELPKRSETVDDIKNELFLLMLKNKLTADEKKTFEELKARLVEKLQK